MKKFLIMIVDDEPANLNILDYMLHSEGYNIAAFPRGDLALKAALNKQPDLVLLDIRMPVMDGYELCKHFKNNDLLKDIPIIFISALDDIQDKVKAFDVGGIDYITKPFNEREVLSRVKIHIQLRQHQYHLEDLVKSRTNELTQAYHRLKIWDDAKDQWLSFLAHEIRTPLNGIFGTMQLLLEKLDDEDADDIKEMYYDAMRRMKNLVDDALMLIRIKVDSENYTDNLNHLDISQYLNVIINNVNYYVKDIQFEVINENDSKLNVYADESLLFKAVQDLIMVTTKCLGPNQIIQIKFKNIDNKQFLIISTNDKSLNKEDIDSFFYPFGQRTLFKGSGEFGLGPVLAKSIIKLFHGSVEIRNKEDGSGFIIEVCFPHP
ncbi:response regulator receiver sensor signal transduction histidine kinase [Candidatus Magnetomorum sp. HK-1]|nr:response regulator receiver sensor signal transduction histidine kinase [Candidatus Magnetomorum sp. HK-1]